MRDSADSIDIVELPGNSDKGWISLQEASELLGVATSTVRRWADAGWVPMKRTLGGHRRFSRAAVLEVARSLVEEVPTRQAREGDLDAERAQQWRARFASHPANGRMRELGQQLLGVLLQFTKRPEEEVRFLAEARSFGERYGAEARAAGIRMYETVEAFLLFCNTHTQYAISPPQSAQAAALAEYLAARARVDRFMDALLVGVACGHERGANDVAGAAEG